MSNEFDAKMEYPEFVKIKIILVESDGDSKDYVKSNARINPFHITSYYEITVGEAKTPATCIIVGSHRYLVDMNISEVDEMINNIDKSVSLK